MDPLGAAASIVSLLQLAGTVIKYLNGLKDASEDIKRLVVELCTVRGLLLTVKDLVTEDSTLQGSLQEQDSLFSQVEASLQLLASKLGGYSTSTTPRLGTRIRWPLRKDEVKEILSAIERQKSLLSLALQNDQICISKDTQSHVHQLTQGVKDLQVAQNDAKANKIFRWLHAPDPSTNHNSAREKHSPTTGSWFIDSDAFQSWWNRPNEFLWVHGLPGCGKSVLASTIIDHTKILCEDHPGYILAYFYFDFRQDKQQTLDGFLRSILVQLGRKASVLPNSITKMYDQHQSKDQQPPLSELIGTFMSLLRQSQPFYLIVDALDECSTTLQPGRDAILSLFRRMKSEELEHVNILVLSRQVRDIEDGLRNTITISICIQNEAVDSDIRLHVRRLLADDFRLRKWPPKVKEEIEASLVRGARGMFRWAVCQIEVLRKCLSVSVLKRALQSLPETLDETYDRVLMAIPSEYHREAYIALQFLSVAGNCVSVADVAEAVAVDRTSCTFDPEDRLADPFDIVEVLSTLVSYSSSQIALSHGEPRHGHFPGAERATEIRLAHYSVKEYLQSDRIRKKDTSKFYVSSYEAEKCAAETCLTYLLWLNQPDSVSAELLFDFPFGLYAAQYWYHHAYLAYNYPDHECDRQSNLIRLNVELFRPVKSSSYINWLRLCDPYRVREGPNFSRQLTNMAPPINYACFLGLLETVRVLRDTGTDIHGSAPGIREPAGQTPLSNAIVGRHESVVKYLLASGAEVNSASAWGRTALHQASLYGDVSIVRLLLTHGAHLEVKTGPSVPIAAIEPPASDPREYIDKDQSPARSAPRRHETARVLVQYLTQKRMHLESRSVTVKPLDEMHECTHGSVLQILLYGGIRAELNSATGWTPLHEAAWGGHEAIIQILCSKGADVEAKTRFGWNPLQMAAYNGHERAVQALLDGNVNVNTRNAYGWTALHLASYCGHPYVVRLLLENGAQIEAETGYGWTPLFGALENWWIMKMLLERGANPNANNSYGGTILHRAARAGLTRAVRLLLEMGADRNLKSLYGTTALEEATMKGHYVIARLLESAVELVGVQRTLTDNKARTSDLRCSSPGQDSEVTDGVDCQNPQACEELRFTFQTVMVPRGRMGGDKGNGAKSTRYPSCEQQVSVLFVCLGNFCRSPIAEAVFRSLTKMDERISRIGSAGVGAEVGSNPDPRTMSVLEKRGIVDYHHEARNIQAADFTSFDYILAMDDYILDDLQGISYEYGISVGAKAKVMLFGDFGMYQGEQVRDVYWGPSEGFDAVYEQIVRLSKGFIAKVLDGNGSRPRFLGTVKAEERIQE